MAPQITKTEDLVAGYALTERIGAGGYGEVWRAQAPGGLAKAVKLVYGLLDDDRASREMKALERIKLVRHPFLISLERIDVADGRLVIVTELADMSLMERCLQCRQENLPGIPRLELLIYLRDAAEALDFMRESFGLQHLDVKPENLLLLAGRVKVADFGLVKDLEETNVSMVSGMTPVYAPPEVFDGRASQQSDQYSLAVVYQEMLTGSLPFPGRTASQLAAQHLHGKPRLGPLPQADRLVIEKALAKSPADRFASCLEMVEALREATNRATAAETKPGETEADTRPVTSSMTDVASPNDRSPARDFLATDVVDRDTSQVDGDLWRTSSMDGQESGTLWLEAPDRPLPVTTLPPVELSEEEVALRPTLVVGVGGMGARVLQKLKSRIRNRFSTIDALPMIEFLQLDTDPETLLQATKGVYGAPLEVRQTLLASLRAVHAYRDDSEIFLQWLSRRWLYNIPRSLRTQGLRPLGRLAFVDHAARILERMRQAVAECTAPEAIAHSEATTDIPVRKESPRVVIVGSISGGAASGMLLDVAHAARSVLASSGHDESAVCGILLHGVSRNPEAKDLACANAFAFLEEMHHYHCFGAPASQRPVFEGRSATFKDTYLLHLGDDLSDQQFDRRLDDVAEYVYRDTTTPVGAHLEKCRRARTGPRNESGEVTLRSFAITTLKHGEARVLAEATDALCHATVTRWLESLEPLQPTPAPPPDAVPTRKSKRTKRRTTEDRVTDILNESNRTAARGRQGGLKDRIAKRLGQYAQTRFADVLAGFVAQRLPALEVGESTSSTAVDAISPWDPQLQDLVVQLQETLAITSRPHLRKPAGRAAAGGAENEEAGEDDPYDWIRATLARRTPALAARLQEDFLRAYFDEISSDHASLEGASPHETDENPWRATIAGARTLWEALRTAAQSVIVHAVREFDRAGPLTASIRSVRIADDRKAVDAWSGALDDITPKLLECGGARRLVAVFPQGPAHVQIVEAATAAWGELPMVVFDSADEAMLCSEMEQLPLPRVAAQLIDYRPDYLQAARRLHTRIDVQWQPICRLP